MIVTWLADVSALWEESVYQRYYEQVPDFRKEKADRLKMKVDKALSVGAWILLEQMKETFHLQDGFAFNISHSGNYALCAVSDRKCVKIGCDIEKVRGKHFKIAERYFCPEECEQIQNIEDFYRFWVLKESFVKATRVGMKMGLNTFAFAFSSEGTPFLTKKPTEFAEKYYFKEYTVENLSYKIAVCSDSSAFEEDIRHIRL